MKVLIVSPFAIMNATFETDLEIVQNHLDRGDDVTMLKCDGELPACEPNLDHHLGLCMRCVSRRKVGVGALTRSPATRGLVKLTAENRKELAELPKSFADLDALRAFWVDELDAGWGVLSTVATWRRDPDPDTRARAELISRTLVSAVTVFRSVQNHIDELRPDCIYLFNGRFALMRAILRASQSRGVDCYMQERGSSFRHYMLYKNRMPHDVAFYQELIRKHWDEGKPEEREVMGASLFIENSQGVSHFWETFIGGQNRDELPAGWDSSKNNVVAYTSSDDEWIAIGDLAKNPVYKDQLDGLTRIAASIANDASIHLYVRIHPFLKDMPKEYLERFYALAASNITVIPPTSTVSTYGLMKAATRILTFGSTTGIEAVYWGKPSILAGTSYYRELGGTYNPVDHDDVVRLLREPALPPKSKEAALVFGYFTRTHGIRFRHFQPTGLGGGPFRGRAIREDLKTRLIARAFLDGGLESSVRKVHLKLLERRLRV